MTKLLQLFMGADMLEITHAYTCF